MPISRLKVWAKEKLKFSDLNREFNNIIENGLTPTGVDDASSNEAAMQATEAPLTAASAVSLATNLLGELKRIRYQIARLTGKTYWYQDPGRILSVNPDDLASYLPFDGESTDEALYSIIRHGAIVNAVTLTASDMGTNDLSASDERFTGYGFVQGSGGIVGLPARQARLAATISLHAKGMQDGDYFAYNPLLGIELYQAASKVVAKFTHSAADTELAKTTTTVTGTDDVDGTDYEHIALAYTAKNGGADSIRLYKSLETASLTSQGSSAANQPINPGNGGIWFFGAKKNSITWDHSVANSVEPDAMTDAWTLSGTDNASVASGILTISTALNADCLYSKATNIDLANLTVEVRAKVGAGGDNPFSGAMLFDCADTSRDARIAALLRQDGKLQIMSSDASTTLGYVHVNSQDYNLFRFTIAASGGDEVIKVYINGAYVATFTNTLSANGAYGADHFKFGVEASLYGDAVAYFEFLGYKGSGAVVAPMAINAAGGHIDDLAVISGDVAATVLTQLKNNAARIVFGSDPKPGSYLPPAYEFESKTSTGNGLISETKVYFVADGESSYTYNFTGEMTGTHADVRVTFIRDSGDYFTFQRRIGNASNVAVNLSLSEVPALGVHSVGMLAVNNSGTSSNSITGQLNIVEN